jgi:hypothetical protein
VTVEALLPVDVRHELWRAGYAAARDHRGDLLELLAEAERLDLCPHRPNLELAASMPEADWRAGFGCAVLDLIDAVVPANERVTEYLLEASLPFRFRFRFLPSVAVAGSHGRRVRRSWTRSAAATR